MSGDTKVLNNQTPCITRVGQRTLT
jgi:hypothetical protein